MKMIKKRVISKGYKFNGKIFIFGGDDDGTVEEFDLAFHKT